MARAYSKTTPPFEESASAGETRAVWLTDFTLEEREESEIRAYAHDLAAHGVTEVFVSVYGENGPLWDSAAYRAAGAVPGVHPCFSRLARIFRDEGLRVVAWFEVGLAIGPASHPIAQAHPEWLQRTLDGTAESDEAGWVFLSPASAPAMDFVTDMLRELATYGFDGIQLDRFRFTRNLAVNARAFGYEAPARERFMAAERREPSEDPLDPEYTRFREMLVAEAVAKATAAIRSVDGALDVSASPVGTYGIGQHMQRWADWMEHMDRVFVQAYNTDWPEYEAHLRAIAEQAALSGHPGKVGVGIYASEADDAGEVERRICLARSLGLRNVTLWTYHFYDGRLAIRDNLDALGGTGGLWTMTADEADAHCGELLGENETLS